MSTLLTGRCLCGRIEFEIVGSVVAKRACWCRTCQYLSCGNASIGVIVVCERVRIAGSEPSEHIATADSGNEIRRQFCPECGTQLFSEALSQPGYIVIRAGALDDRREAGPESVLWTESAPPWAHWDREMPAFHGQVDAATNETSRACETDGQRSLKNFNRT
jgi:hypothetical protein